MPSDRRARVLWPLALAGCALPTPLGERPSITATTTTAAGDDVSSVTVGSTVAPPSMTGDSGSPGPPPPHAWAMRYDEWRAAPGNEGEVTGANSGGMGDTGGSGLAPDTLVVQISNGPDDCDDPHATVECADVWTVTLMIPPELQAPGTYDLLDLRATALDWEPHGDTSCSFGGGTLEGTAELFEVSPQVVSGHVSPTNGAELVALDEFVAPRC